MRAAIARAVASRHRAARQLPVPSTQPGTRQRERIAARPSLPPVACALRGARSRPARFFCSLTLWSPACKPSPSLPACATPYLVKRATPRYLLQVRYQLLLPHRLRLTRPVPERSREDASKEEWARPTAVNNVEPEDDTARVQRYRCAFVGRLDPAHARTSAPRPNPCQLLCTPPGANARHHFRLAQKRRLSPRHPRRQ